MSEISNSPINSLPEQDHQGLGLSVVQQHTLVSGRAQKRHIPHPARVDRISLSSRFFHRRHPHNSPSVVDSSDLPLLDLTPRVPIIQSIRGLDNDVPYKPFSTQRLLRTTNNSVFTAENRFSQNAMSKGAGQPVIRAVAHPDIMSAYFAPPPPKKANLATSLLKPANERIATGPTLINKPVVKDSSLSPALQPLAKPGFKQTGKSHTRDDDMLTRPGVTLHLPITGSVLPALNLVDSQVMLQRHFFSNSGQQARPLKASIPASRSGINKPYAPKGLSDTLLLHRENNTPLASDSQYSMRQPNPSPMNLNPAAQALKNLQTDGSLNGPGFASAFFWPRRDHNVKLKRQAPTSFINPEKQRLAPRQTPLLQAMPALNRKSELAATVSAASPEKSTKHLRQRVTGDANEKPWFSVTSHFPKAQTKTNPNKFYSTAGTGAFAGYRTLNPPKIGTQGIAREIIHRVFNTPLNNEVELFWRKQENVSQIATPIALDAPNFKNQMLNRALTMDYTNTSAGKYLANSFENHGFGINSDAPMGNKIGSPHKKNNQQSAKLQPKHAPLTTTIPVSHIAESATPLLQAFYSIPLASGLEKAINLNNLTHVSVATHQDFPKLSKEPVAIAARNSIVNRKTSDITPVQLKNSSVEAGTYQPGLLPFLFQHQTPKFSHEATINNTQALRLSPSTAYRNVKSAEINYVNQQTPKSGPTDRTVTYSTLQINLSSPLTAPIRRQPITGYQPLLKPNNQRTFPKLNNAAAASNFTGRKMASAYYAETAFPVSIISRSKKTTGLSNSQPLVRTQIQLETSAIPNTKAEKSTTELLRMPLSNPVTAQPVVTISELLANGYGSYLQQLAVPNDKPLNFAGNVSPTSQTAQTQTAPTTEQNLSTEELVDKVWRKLMRKLAAEQERTGGCNRWA
ncbi:MAG: hypothetical protein HOP34_13005 [Methylococcaceae bacterium]|nr:hypothetical protein [Methylococcaceae bacterium]